MQKNRIYTALVVVILLLIASKNKVMEMLGIPKKLLNSSDLLAVWSKKFTLNQTYVKSLEILQQISSRFGVSIEDVLKVIYFESKFSPTITNSIGATGLIQFMPSTARGLGTSTAALRQMSIINQLPFVKKYFFQYESKNINLAQLYLLVLRGKLVTFQNEDTLLKQYFGTYQSPNQGGKQAKYLYAKDGYISLASVENAFKIMFP